MIRHDKLTIIRNRQRASDLARFRRVVELYFSRIEYVDDLPVDWEGARDARAGINRLLPRIIEIVNAAGLGERSSVVGSRNRGAASLRDIFDSRDTLRTEEEVLDLIDMAIGVYQADLYSALWRTANPLHYAGVALGFVLGLPKKGLTALGLVRTGPHAAAMLPAEQVTMFEDVAARLADGQDSIETRLAEVVEHQERMMSEHAAHLTELADRVEFAERKMVQGKDVGAANAEKDEEAITPA